MPGAKDILYAIFRGHRSFVVEGVRYRERTTEPLRRALSDRGTGAKDFDALFPDAAPLRIRCTPERQYADIAGDRVLAPYTLADPIIRPGMRVLDIRCSTGYGADHLARLVGPAGAVVALETDHESIRYARRRYDPGTISFEIGGLEALEGELDASFDAVVAVNLFCALAEAPALASSLWRVLAPGGPMLLVQPLPVAGKPVPHDPKANPHHSKANPETPDASPLRLSTAELRNTLLDLAPSPGIEPAETIDLAAVIARKPAANPPPNERHAPHPGRSYPPMR